MKFLLSALFLWVIVATPVTAQDSVGKSNTTKSVEKEKQLQLKSTKSAKSNPVSVEKTKTISPRTSSKGNWQMGTTANPSLSKNNVIQYEKTGDALQDAANYQAAKEAYLAKNPPAKQVLPKQSISRTNYNKLPEARKAVIDANPSRYQIID